MNGTSMAAVVLAAGLSRRMGSFKLLLPWDGHTVIGQVVTTLAAAGLSPILAVVGHRAGEVAAALAGSGAMVVANPRYAEGEMISSIQAGLAALADSPAGIAATLLCLGDQPQLQAETVCAVLAAGAAGGCQKVVIPSYEMRAGHPILLPRWLWPEIMAGPPDLRSVLKAHREQTLYLAVDTPAVLADLDTPADYARWQARDPDRAAADRR
jgi:molybdenum cofactor cytidylyltransferase